MEQYNVDEAYSGKKKWYKSNIFQRPESKFVDDNKLQERLHYIVARKGEGKRKVL